MISDKKKNIIILITILIVVVYYSIVKPKEEVIVESILETEKEQEVVVTQIDEIPEKIVVHVSGAVKKEGIVTLLEGDRIIDAIEYAGGTNEDADLSQINLALKLQDGLKIHIPVFGEVETVGVSTYVGGLDEGSTSQSEQMININTATQDQLEQLPGVGPSTAQKILLYREEFGIFKEIEEVKNVSGIGDSKYDSMKEFITVK